MLSIIVPYCCIIIIITNLLLLLCTCSGHQMLGKDQLGVEKVGRAIRNASPFSILKPRIGTLGARLKASRCNGRCGLI